ncbi:hypothetical protein ASG37_06170 [Sphingomonas sp. Leaf407]|nr:hypothetical protein ASE97_16105 [Sphingomonas sp. Leaf42]KQT30637.1 hypothetical protein ASG37_06170 [Sphingomonas sp. Leaf407]
MVPVILVNWNGWRDSIACIRACLALDHPARIVVCDNASHDGSVERIAAWARGETPTPDVPDSPVSLSERRPHGVAILDRAAAERGEGGDAELLLIRTGGNLGFAGGNNVGLRWALTRGCTHAWLLNNDTVVAADALGALVRLADSDPAIGLVGSVLVEYHRPGRLQGYAGALDLRSFKGRHLGIGVAASDPAAAMLVDPVRPHERCYPIGASMLVTAAFLRDVGLMEERYFLYYEEADWALRGHPRYRVAIAADSIVYHKIGASAGSTPQGLSAQSTGFLYRSRLACARRFAQRRVPWVAACILSEAGRALLRGRTGRAIGAVRALTGRVRAPR